MAEIEKAAREKGAESVVLAGAIFAGLAPVLKDRVSIPIIDGIVAGVGQLRMLHSLNVGKPKLGGYCYPPRKRPDRRIRQPDRALSILSDMRRASLPDLRRLKSNQI